MLRLEAFPNVGLGGDELRLATERLGDREADRLSMRDCAAAAMEAARAVVRRAARCLRGALDDRLLAAFRLLL